MASGMIKKTSHPSPPRFVFPASSVPPNTEQIISWQFINVNLINITFNAVICIEVHMKRDDFHIIFYMWTVWSSLYYVSKLSFCHSTYTKNLVYLPFSVFILLLLKLILMLIIMVVIHTFRRNIEQKKSVFTADYQNECIVRASCIRLLAVCEFIYLIL